MAAGTLCETATARQESERKENAAKAYARLFRQGMRILRFSDSAELGIICGTYAALESPTNDGQTCQTAHARTGKTHSHLATEVMLNRKTQVDRNRLETELRVAQQALEYFRRALELEENLQAR